MTGNCLNDPASIYNLSFKRVEVAISDYDVDPIIKPVITRLVHACGMPDIVPDLVFSPDIVKNSVAALQAGAAIICDCEMVAAGITRRFLPAQNQIIVTLNDERTEILAQKLSKTRSAAAAHLWGEAANGAIIAIGNAPTCLFELLAFIKTQQIAPASVLGFPVGFVGAKESKQALIETELACDYVTLTGTRGGSALASAAVNSLCRLAQGYSQ